MTSIIKRTNHMEKQCQFWHRDTVRFERTDNQENGKAQIDGSIDKI